MKMCYLKKQIVFSLQSFLSKERQKFVLISIYQPFFLSYSQIQQIVSSFCSSLHIELQQRGAEFSKLFGKYNHLTAALLERMPPLERSQSETQANGDIENGESRVVDDSPQHVDRESVCNSIVFCII